MYELLRGITCGSLIIFSEPAELGKDKQPSILLCFGGRKNLLMQPSVCDGKGSKDKDRGIWTEMYELHLLQEGKYMLVS